MGQIDQKDSIAQMSRMDQKDQIDQMGRWMRRVKYDRWKMGDENNISDEKWRGFG